MKSEIHSNLRDIFWPIFPENDPLKTIFVVRRVHAKCTAFNLQRKLLPIFIKPPKGFGDDSEARLFLDIKDSNFFSFADSHFQHFLQKTKLIYTSDHQPFPAMSPVLQKAWKEEMKRNFQGAATPVKLPQSCHHHPSPDQGSTVGSSIPNRNELSSPLPADITWNKNRAKLSKKQVILGI